MEPPLPVDKLGQKIGIIWTFRPLGIGLHCNLFSAHNWFVSLVLSRLPHLNVL